MTNLSNNIYRYYLQRFDELPVDKQFHFASRLYLWSQDSSVQQHLETLRTDFCANESPEAALRTVVNTTRQLPVLGSKNAGAIRKPYFEKYPLLKLYVAALFRVTFLRTIYRLEATEDLYNLFPKDELQNFAERLLADPQAIVILSTHAVNFLYLYSRIVSQDTSLFRPEYFLQIGKKYYDYNDPIQLQLFIYLYTHCIIGESQFYFRSVGPDTVYDQMLSELEALIDQHFQAVNLDNKFEFLVCARLLRRPTGLADRIYEEAGLSLSPDGDFLIDTHNNNPQRENVDIATSEHRNILFILSNRAYRPLG